MVVVGIDPGTATTGYGLVRETPGGIEAVTYGVITTPAGIPLEKRLLQLYSELKEIIGFHQPKSAAVEKLFFQRTVTSALSVGHARGIALLVMAEMNIPVCEYSPLEVKQAVSGYGGADKHQVQQMVKILLNLPELPHPDDAADALAVAICHLHSSTIDQLLE